MICNHQSKSDSDSDCKAIYSLDLDGCLEFVLSLDEDCLPSSPDNDGKQEDYCSANEGDESPSKRCKTDDSTADAPSHRASSIRSASGLAREGKGGGMEGLVL